MQSILQVNVNDLSASSFWFMWSSSLFLDALREFRFWSSPAGTCPWGFIALAIWVSCLCGCCFGILAGIFVASRWCRQVALQLLGVLLQALHPAPLVGPTVTGLQRRFGEYRA